MCKQKLKKHKGNGMRQFCLNISLESMWLLSPSVSCFRVHSWSLWKFQIDVALCEVFLLCTIIVISVILDPKVYLRPPPPPFPNQSNVFVYVRASVMSQLFSTLWFLSFWSFNYVPSLSLQLNSQLFFNSKLIVRMQFSSGSEPFSIFMIAIVINDEIQTMRFV